ncbi:MAG: lysine--tRNA ligase [Candidatus Diapherotrites archaeon]|nr:lysine--tRNA ligase [Candidatus Diapherotrites archaeon]
MEKNLFWAESIVDRIVMVKKKIYVCEGMWTPSGFFHIGNARPEIFTPHAVYSSLKERGFAARQNFIVDDFDAVRKIPQGLGVSKEKEGLFLGFPCATAPSPVTGYKSWADFFVSDVKEHINEFGVKLNILSAFKTYKEGKFNDLIKFSLEHSKEIVRVWNRVAGSSKSDNFIPVQVVCEQCKRLVEALKWDGKFVHYSCGYCKFYGTVLPRGGKVKLHWRVHWVCHWIVHGVSFESGGKDHFSKGGSVEVGRALLKEVFGRPPIFQLPTEFIQLKGEKMSGSVGNVINLGNWLEIASAEMFRYLIFSARPNAVIEMSFNDNNFLLLDERFQRAERIFFGKEQAENKKIESQIKHAFKLASIKELPKKIPVQVPFSFCVLLCQIFDPKTELGAIEKVLLETGHVGKKLSAGEKKILLARLLRVKNWVEKYAPQEFRIKFVESIADLDLKKVSPKVFSVLLFVKSVVEKANSPQEVQQGIFDVAKEYSLEPKELFSSLYYVFLGKERGPKLGSLVFAIGKEKIIKRLDEII